MLDPPNPSWATLEQTYEIYPASAFTTYGAYLDKRRQWLQQIGLDIIPFCYKTLELSEGNMQDGNPVVDSWSDFEYTYDFIKEKDKEFKNDAAGYAKKHGYWIIDIGLNFDPFNDAYSFYLYVFARSLVQKAEKAGDNYKAPPSEAKKTSKRSSAAKSSSRPLLEIMDIRVMGMEGMEGMGDIKMTNIISVFTGFLLTFCLRWMV
ncbi:45ec2879-895b-4cec-99b9-c58cb3ec0db6 [Sclerotinia trifoliorum]|uniref:45ec2879-895b-4cec-99b9-c58cb3ec0db6 n=1 Tax=Sclerotinia trifoliorum TaxID=28548 RepID=A0A8H2VQ31_9HELO|nr:45ec2879-895b-4cec-99b9-c58cb3ec0db6 [Sclerotinia trifoliorum]